MSKFEFIVIFLSAAMAGTGVAMGMNDDWASAFLCVGAAIKMVTGLERMPIIDLQKIMNTTSADEMRELLEREREENDQKKPILAWMSEFATYLIFGGFFILMLEML